MNAETLKKSKRLKVSLKDNIKEMSQKESFYGHCELHLMQDKKDLIEHALDEKNTVGIGSCFNFSKYEDLKKYLVSNMLQEPLYSEIALWLAEGSDTCAFYIDSPNCGMCYSKWSYHDWNDGPLVCNQAILVLERQKTMLPSYDFRIKTAYTLPD